MNWKTQVELVYRVFGRQMEDTTLRFDDMRNELQELYPVRSSFGEIRQYNWPVDPEKLKEIEAKGYFVVMSVDRPCVVIRELPITIICDGLEHAEEQLAPLNEKFPNKFAVIRVVKEIITEMQAE